MKSKWPRVIANFAITADGKVSTRNFTPTSFTGPKDKGRLREIRASGDAVLVGANTVTNDQMSMGLSSPVLKKKRQLAGQSREPLRVIVSNRGNIAPHWKVFKKGSAPVIVFSTQKMSGKTREWLAPRADLWLFEQSPVDLAEMLSILRKDYGVRTLVCEGGPSLFRSLLELGAVNELRLTWAPLVFGGEKAPTLTGLPGKFLTKTIGARLSGFEEAAGEYFLSYRLFSSGV